MKNSLKTSLKREQAIIIVTFLLVPILLVAIFNLLPIINMFAYSFLKWDGLGKKKFIGLSNYKELFTRPENFKVFATSLYYFAGSLVQLVLAVFFAVILCSKMRGSSFFKGILFFPTLINGVAIGFIFQYFFRGENGTLNTILSALGVKNPPLWLSNPKLVNYSLSFTSVWRYMGFNLVMFIAAIQSLPADTYEAASLDGASGWQQFRYITLPGIMPILQINAILAIKGAVSVFEIPYIMTGGGSGSSTFVIRTMDTAFKFNKIGLASSMAIVLTIIVIVVSAIQNMLFANDKGGK